MKAFVEVILVLGVATYTTTAIDDPETGECDMDWEPRDGKDTELRLTAEYAAQLYSQQQHLEYKDIVVNVLKGWKKPCRWPKFNITATYGTSNCKTNDFDTLECTLVPEKGLRKCRTYMYTPPGRGSKLGAHVCEKA
ncbi:hypothetical protein BIW11_05249 [Tropilaelaps mercedesae]|uniref:Uncharacterized protein n=1 Tax=Tropilaelaps mercedesae TaxID=418985 RepID=A0A1V9Y366_9ACAR|nr:hypothetical protein BIW11_05249 [Tropilaelaps mercedesae]